MYAADRQVVYGGMGGNVEDAQDVDGLAVGCLEAGARSEVVCADPGVAGGAPELVVFGGRDGIGLSAVPSIAFDGDFDEPGVFGAAEGGDYGF